MAEHVAEKITASLKKKVEEAELAFAERVTKLLEARVPKEVKIAAELYPKWFSTRETVEVDGNGYYRRRIKLSKKVLFKDHWGSNVDLAKAEAEQLNKLNLEVEKAKDRNEDDEVAADMFAIILLKDKGYHKAAQLVEDKFLERHKRKL